MKVTVYSKKLMSMMHIFYYKSFELHKVFVLFFVFVTKKQNSLTNIRTCTCKT